MNRRFLKDLLERAIKTFAQVAAAEAVADGTGLLSTDWVALLSLAGMAAVLSVLTSLASLPLGDSGTASAVSLGPSPVSESDDVL